MNCTIDEKATCLLLDSGLSEGYWAEAMRTATFQLNRLPSSAIKNCSPYEVLYQEKPIYHGFRTFGSTCWAHIHNAKKMSAKSRRCTFVGYGLEFGKKAYRLVETGTRKIVYSRDVIFEENVLEEKKSISFPISLDVVHSTGSIGQQQEEGTADSLEEQEEGTVDLLEEEEEEDENDKVIVQKELTPCKTCARPPVGHFKALEEGKIRRSNFAARATEPSDWNKSDFSLPTQPPPRIPKTYEDAMNSPYSKEWENAMKDELGSMKEHQVWEMVPLPEGRKAIGTKWVFDLKKDKSGAVI